MNNMLVKISQLFGQKDISDYPELYHKNTSDTIENRINMANLSVFHDSTPQPRYINWKSL